MEWHQTWKCFVDTDVLGQKESELKRADNANCNERHENFSPKYKGTWKLDFDVDKLKAVDPLILALQSPNWNKIKSEYEARQVKEKTIQVVEKEKYKMEKSAQEEIYDMPNAGQKDKLQRELHKKLKLFEDDIKVIKSAKIIPE